MWDNTVMKRVHGRIKAFILPVCFWKSINTLKSLGWLPNIPEDRDHANIIIPILRHLQTYPPSVINHDIFNKTVTCVSLRVRKHCGGGEG